MKTNSGIFLIISDKPFEISMQK